MDLSNYKAWKLCGLKSRYVIIIVVACIFNIISNGLQAI